MTTISTGPIPRTHGTDAQSGEQTPPKHHPHRWRLHRAGFIDVWFYFDTEFDMSGGRLVLRGTNGAGKSRALELLLPFVLDADRRKMDSTGSGKVSLTELMKAGAEDRTTRAGYVWLECARTLDPEDLADADLLAAGRSQKYFTVGAHVRYSRSTNDVKVHYFTTELRVGHDLQLMSQTRETLPREKLADIIGADRLTTTPATHRDRVRATLFALTGEAGAERYAGLLQLLHTLRSPDVGNRIDEGKLPQILSDALPPLSDAALNAAGDQLDSLSDTRAAQGRLEAAQHQVNAFLNTYRRYAATAIGDAADTAGRAAADADRAAKKSRDNNRAYAQLETDHAIKQAQTLEMAESIAELGATIAGIKGSEAYKSARDLDEREKRVEALGSAADIALGAAARARAAEERAMNEANNFARGLKEAASQARSELEQARTKVEAAGGEAGLPVTIEAAITLASPVTELVRLVRDGDSEGVARPVADEVKVEPADLPGTAEKVNLVTKSATEREHQAEGRLSTARNLERVRHKVDEADRRTEAAEGRAKSAEVNETECHDDMYRACAQYAQRWSTWQEAEETLNVFGETPDLSGTLLQAVLEDPNTLATIEPTAPDADETISLEGLDRVAEAIAAPRREAQTRRVLEIEALRQADQGRRTELENEQKALQRAVDPHPTSPTWLQKATDNDVPLWRTVDFAEGLDATERAGLEGALLASGLLLATIKEEGVRAEDGQLLLTPKSPRVTSPLLGKLVPDSASPISTTVIERILSQISTHPTADDHTLWVSSDGSWGSGPLNGRHVPAHAKHIGAAAREKSRNDRLDEIATELAVLDTLKAERRRELDTLAEAIRLLNSVVHAAPRTQGIATTKALAMTASATAATERSAAHAAAALAEDLRRAWAKDNSDHIAICDEFSLPHTADELELARRSAAEAAGACQRVVRALEQVGDRVRAHDRALRIMKDLVGERREEEEFSSEKWMTWHREKSEFEAVRHVVGSDADTAREELRKAQAQHEKLSNDVVKERAAESELSGKKGAAEVEARNAADAVEVADAELLEAVDKLRVRLALPGIAAAAFTDAPVVVDLPQVTPAAVRAAVDAVTAGLRRRGTSLDENTLTGPQRTLEQELSGTYDVQVEIREGVRLVELLDAGGRRSVAKAAEELTRLVDDGRNALSDRERDVFTEFILGGVAEEMRRRLDQAEDLIAAMNTSLSSIRTSHGIGVKLRWRVAESSDPSVARIKELVSTAGAVRSVEQTSELTDLLKARVDDAFALDESAGYATHLSQSLDYRSWHVVEVIILGPAQGQERRISRKAKLSQGETRFVSYVTLFAAMDAYLSGLPDHSRALRMLLLDDAFAKVDDRTIGELMGLLVRLDLDFAMTAHLLWGTYPQVPALDCYEVRRVEGGGAYTTHMHWDGHTRHLRPTR